MLGGSPLGSEGLDDNPARSGRCSGDGCGVDNSPLRFSDSMVDLRVDVALPLDSRSISLTCFFHSMWALTPGFWCHPKSFFVHSSVAWIHGQSQLPQFFH